MATIKEKIYQKFLDSNLPKISDNEIMHRKITYDADFLSWAALYPDRLVNPQKVTDYLFEKICGKAIVIPHVIIGQILTSYPIPFVRIYLERIVQLYDCDQMINLYHDVNLVFTHRISLVVNDLISRADQERLNFLFDSEYFILKEIGKKIPIYLYSLGYGAGVGKCGLRASFSDNDNAVRFITKLEGMGLSLNPPDGVSPFGYADPLHDALRNGHPSIVMYILSGLSNYQQDSEYISGVFDMVLGMTNIDSEILEFVQKTKQTWLGYL